MEKKEEEKQQEETSRRQVVCRAPPPFAALATPLTRSVRQGKDVGSTIRFLETTRKCSSNMKGGKREIGR